MIEASAGRARLYLISDFPIEEEHLALIRQLFGEATGKDEVEDCSGNHRGLCCWPLRVDSRGEGVATVARHIELCTRFLERRAHLHRSVRDLGCNLGLAFDVEAFEPYLRILPSTMKRLAGWTGSLDFNTPHHPSWRPPPSLTWEEKARMEMLGWRGQGKSGPSVARARLALISDFPIRDDYLPLIRQLLGEETTEAEVEFHPPGSRRMCSWPVRVKDSFGDPVRDLGHQIWQIEGFLSRRRQAVRGLRELGGNLELCLHVEAIGDSLSLGLHGFASHQVAVSFFSPEHPAWRPP